MPEGWAGTGTWVPSPAGRGQSPPPRPGPQKAGWDAEHCPWAQEVGRCPPSRACGLPGRQPPISQPPSAPMSSAVWGQGDFYLKEAQPKQYLILYIVNHYNGETSLVANLLGA